jgi:hypothetical protein
MSENKEDKKQDVDIALLSQNITHITRAISRIEGRLDIMDKNYIHREEVNKELYGEEGLKPRMRNIEIDYATFKSKVLTWGAAGVVVLGVAQFVLAKYF